MCIRDSIGVDIKAKILEDVRNAVREFEARPDIKTKFGDPIVGYADTRNGIFDMYFSRRICDHPKRIYRPGNTAVVHFVPYAQEILESNRGGDKPSQQWTDAFNESMWLSMRLNGEMCIRDSSKAVVDVSAEIDDKIARRRLECWGIRIDALTPEQEKYLNSWQV